MRAGLGVETRYYRLGRGHRGSGQRRTAGPFCSYRQRVSRSGTRSSRIPLQDAAAVFRATWARNGEKFEELLDEAGPAVAEAHSSRGCAFGDFDNDGDVDILIMNMNEPPSLLRNDVSGSGHWLKVMLVGTASNRSAIGSRVTAAYDDKTQAQEVNAQSSFYSVHDRRLHFGLGAASAADLEIRWTNGGVERVKGVAANQLVVIQEGKGIVRTERWSKPVY